jgi:TPP-dependent pyruvate/acetoin dehydrogenase alpha subunit
MTAASSYENPLIPNARLKQIYLAMVRARMFARALPARRRGGWMPGMEACLASTSVDLEPRDLVRDAFGGEVVEFLRRVKPAKRGGVVAECGAAHTLPGVVGIAERLWAAVGAAAALKAAGQAGVEVVYVLPGEVPAALWRKVLGFAVAQVLPIFFVVLPGAQGAKVGAVSALAHECTVPGISVDGDDAVAIYRVAQESIGRARIGGGAVVMECVPFVVKGKKGEDAIAGMERYLLQRGVVTKGWMEREARGFGRRLGTK